MFFNQRFNFDCGKGKGRVSTQAKRPSQRELILVSIAWSNWGYHCSPLDASPSQGYAAAAPPPPSSYISSGFSDNFPVPIYTAGWREALRG